MSKIRAVQCLILLSVCFYLFFTPTVASAQTDPDTILNNSAAILNAKTPEEKAKAAETASKENYNPGPSEDGESPDVTKADLGLSTFQWILYQFFTGIGGIVLWFGGFMLDYTMKLLVVDMAGAITRFGMGAAIDSLWTVVRDIFNLVFIFGLIYIGFMTILRSDESGTKRLLGSIIAAALLINFSLYATKVVIDFTNVAAYQVYQLIQIDGSYQSALVGEVKGVAGKFMEMTDLSSYTKSASGELKKIASSSFGTFKVLGFSIIVMVFMLMSGFVFLSGAILLLSRFITLILLMIFSPAMFLGWVFPGFAAHSRKWWDTLLRNAFVAPAYLFMIYLSLRTLETMQFSSSSFGEAYSTEAGETGLFGFFLYYLIIIGFVYASLVVARNIGAVGANQAMATTDFLRRKVQGFAGRNTIGRLSGAAQGGFTRWQEKPVENQSRVGRFIRGVLSTTNLDRSIVSTTEKGKAAKFGDSYSLKENQDYAEARQRRLVSGADAQRRESSIENTTSALQSNPIAVTSQQMREFADSVRNLSQKQLTEDITFETLTNQNVAIHLSDAQIDTIRASGRFDDGQIRQIRDARRDGFINIANGTAGPNNVANHQRNAEWLGTRSAQQMAQMPAAVFASPHMAQYITPNMIDARLREGGIDDADVMSIRDNLQLYLNPLPGTVRPAGMPAPAAATVRNWRNWAGRSAFANRLGLTL